MSLEKSFWFLKVAVFLLLISSLPVAGEWLLRSTPFSTSFTAATWTSDGAALAVGATVNFLR